MGTKCKTCSHPDLDLIDRLLVDGISNRRISTQFRLSESSVRRHAQRHLPENLLKSKKAKDMARSDDLVTKLQELESDTNRLQLKLERTGDLRGALSAIREKIRLYEMIEKMLRVRELWIHAEDVKEVLVWLNKLAVKHIPQESREAYGGEVLSYLPRYTKQAMEKGPPPG